MEVHYKICPICGMSMDIEETKCPACGYGGLQTTGGFGRTITHEQIEAIPKPSINIQEIRRKIQEAEEEHEYWQHFRREAAKDLLPLATQMKDYRGFPEQCVSLAIQLADELIKQLREEKK